MGSTVPRALIATLLTAGIFCAPLFASLSYAEEIATSTPESVIEVIPETVTETAATTTEQVAVDVVPAPTEIVTSSATLSEFVVAEVDVPLPTGVLLDRSLADESWSLDIRTGGRYVYFFNGYASLGNPPVLSSEHAWVSTGTTTTARVKKVGDTTCDQLRFGATGGLSMSGPTWTGYSTARASRPDSGEYCDFYFEGGGIPPGTQLSMIALGAYGTTTVAGSRANPGTSLDGYNEDPVSGGFAFQLCGISGCSGGFATTSAPTTPQVSNVLFLPGIKGSRLYHEVSICDGMPGVCDETLWEPYGDVLARKLLLDFDGTSIDDVFVKEEEIIDEAGGQKFYSSFIEDMDELQASTTYNGGDFEWRAAAYDWRLSLPDIINNGVQYEDRIYYDQATSTPYIEQTLRELANTSTTGKVTIIAHSNGGLVTKALLQKLGDVETARLVDKIIFVGVPQTGAPQALGALLFGYGESLPGKVFLPDILISKEVSRELAENSPMAYHLMPSDTYLSDAQDSEHSIIGFSGSHLYQAEQGAYGPSIDTVTELDNFLLAREGGRTKPLYTDLTVANVLNPNLISYANDTHTSIDSWVPPASVMLYQIAGWGANTISGIDFYDEQKLLGVTTGYKRQYRPIFVEDGDRVVPVPSALMMSTASNVHSYWLNLAKARKDHGDLFESQDLRDFLSNTLTNISELPNLMSETAPVPEPDFKKLIFQLHSPLTLGLYDSDGNFTGLNPDGSVSDGIPGAEYGEFGDVKYLIAPAGAQYQLVMLGQSAGTFSLDIQEQIGNTITSSATIADVPTTASTIAKLTITSGVADASSLAVDTDGNGTTDTTVSAQVGETVNYVPPSAPAPSTSSGSSSNHKQATTIPAAALVSAVLAPFVPAAQVVASVPATLKAAVAGITSAESTPGTNNVQGPATTPDVSQTASVYNALAPLTEWLKTLMYNIWKGLRYIIQSLH